MAAFNGLAALEKATGKKEEEEIKTQIKDPHVLWEAELTKLISKLSTTVPEFGAASVWRGRSGDRDAAPGGGNGILEKNFGKSTLNLGTDVGADDFELFRCQAPAGLKCLAFLNEADSTQREADAGRASLAQALLAMPTSITGLYEADEAVASAIEIVKRGIVREGETYIKAWPLQAINAAGKVEERLCVLTSHGWYKMSFNYQRMEAKNVKRYCA